MPNKKKPALTPEAARILEQYRNAGSKAASGGRDAGEPGSADATPNQSRAAAPPAAAQRRSGTRGK